MIFFSSLRTSFSLVPGLCKRLQLSWLLPPLTLEHSTFTHVIYRWFPSYDIRVTAYSQTGREEGRPATEEEEEKEGA